MTTAVAPSRANERFGKRHRQPAAVRGRRFQRRADAFGRGSRFRAQSSPKRASPCRARCVTLDGRITVSRSSAAAICQPLSPFDQAIPRSDSPRPQIEDLAGLSGVEIEIDRRCALSVVDSTRVKEGRARPARGSPAEARRMERAS